MIDRQEIDNIYFSKKKRNRIDIPLDVYVSLYHLPILFYIVISALSKKK